MKNKKFLSMLMVVVLMMSFAITGCGKKIEPKEAAQVWWEIAFNNTANVSKINLKESDATAAIEKEKQEVVDELKTQFSAQGISFSDDKFTELYNALIDTSKKANVTIEEVSNDGKTAEVKFTSNHIDYAGIITQATTDALESIQASGMTDPNEAKDKYMELYMENLINGIKNAKFSDDTKTLNYKLTMKDNVWQPDSADDFSDKITNLVLGAA